MNIKVAVIAALFAASPFAAGDTLHLPNHGEGISNSTEVVHAIQSHTFTSATVQTGNIQAGGLKTYQVSAKVGYIHHLNSAGIMNNGAQITSVGAGTVGADAVNLNQLNAVQASASANTSTTTGDTTTLNRANADSQIMANSAQSNSYAYTNQQSSATLNQANSNAQGYASRAQNNAENFAQGAANRAQMRSDHYAASGIAAALAMPSSPYLRPGHYALGVQGGFYGGMSAVGGRATYQVTRHWSLNAGISSGTGPYSEYAETAGAQWEN